MIALLQGIIHSKDENGCILLCHHTHLLRTIITRAGENSTEMASSTENKMQLLFQKKYHQNNRVNNWTAFVRNNPDRIRSKDDK